MAEPERACPNCEAVMPTEAAFCFRCGAAMPPAGDEAAADGGADPKERAALQAALGDGYRVVGAVGAGGMATVYRAEDLRHRRPVAVKVLRPDLAATVGAERFLQEIELAARLHHPHILALHDSGEAGGLLYYVMPFVDGETLEHRLARQGRLPPDEATRLAREVAEAMRFAHERGVVHRDIKPGNVLLQDGHALVTDFGIARALTRGGAALTEIGYAVGTAYYMSPEQAMGESDVDGRTDVYAIGAVLYEMLGGSPPFDGSSSQSVIAKKITTDPEPLDCDRLGIPRVLNRVVRRAMARDPEDRYRTAAELADALELVDMNVLTEGVRTALGARSATEAAAAGAGSHRRLAVAAGVTTAAALALLYWAGDALGWSSAVFVVAAGLLAAGGAVTYAVERRRRRDAP